jgi:hypothetical protein
MRHACNPVAVVLAAAASLSLAPTCLAQPAAPEKPAARAPASSRPIPAAGLRLDALALSRLIDQHVLSRLDAEGLKPSPTADNAEFLRRAYLDLTGVIPPAEKVVEFLDQPGSNKRGQLIDDLLAEKRFGTHLAEVWAGSMVPRQMNNRRLDTVGLKSWLADAFNSGKPWDKTVYDLVTATGSPKDSGAVTFFIGNPTPDKMTDQVTRLFLGVQLQCAQCHNHPFTGWKQTEYWAMAAFFMKVRLNGNPKQAAKRGVGPAVFEGNGPRGKLPVSAKFVPAKFLQGEQPKLRKDEPYRPVLAKWMTAPENPYFARAMVNKMWAHFFGRGLVNPVDDMHDANEPSHPELLAALTEQFKASGFDVKYLARAICNSQAYQRSSRPANGNKDDTNLYSHMPVRVMSPEQMYDSLFLALARDGAPPLKQPKGPKGKGPAGNPREFFLTFFRIDEGENPLEYQAGIPQALRLMNAPLVNANGPAIARAVKTGGFGPARVIEQLYLSTVSRRPTPDELQRRVAYVREQERPRDGFADILWALLNSSEFVTNH